MIRSRKNLMFVSSFSWYPYQSFYSLTCFSFRKSSFGTALFIHYDMSKVFDMPAGRPSVKPASFFCMNEESFSSDSISSESSPL